jgi:hypothetical protein
MLNVMLLFCTVANVLQQQQQSPWLIGIDDIVIVWTDDISSYPNWFTEGRSEFVVRTLLQHTNWRKEKASI